MLRTIAKKSGLFQSVDFFHALLFSLYPANPLYNHETGCCFQDSSFNFVFSGIKEQKS
jgi:hypothetical protein